MQIVPTEIPLNFDLPSVTVVRRAANFETKFIANCNNMLLL